MGFDLAAFLASFVVPTLTTVFFFVFSAALSLFFAVIYVLCGRSHFHFLRVVSGVLIEVSRGVPTVVFVLLMGNLGLSPYFSVLDMEGVIPGVSWGFSVAAIFIIVGLAFSSSGHLAKIIEAAISTIKQDTIEYMETLQLGTWVKIKLVFIECAPALVPTVSARLVHHLHNTAFISMFPITGIFAAMRTGVVETALVIPYLVFATILFVLLGSGVHIIGNLFAKRLRRRSDVDPSLSLTG
ncbi:ABC transporter permease subunit [Enterovibrio sp. 27052020O]|uniref:ABC transporter permease subunit n=1 Tax=Enterovibrio sp. 27052020O TaxID=3241166 RepID=UPI003890F90B